MYYKKLSLKTRRDIMILLVLIFIVSITIGYALLSSNLGLIGTSTINNPTWDVHWNNVVVKDGSVEGTKVTTAANITNPTTVEFAVKLDAPGEYYEFTVDAVNEGSIDAMIGTISNKVYAANGTTEKQLGSYLEYTISYSDGQALAQKQLLSAGSTETYKVLLKFKDNITGSQLPSSLDQYIFRFTIDYVQATDEAVEVIHPYLYNVLKSAAEEGTYAKEYTGNHQDSMAGVGDKKIYHWYADNDIDGTAILDKNNVVFANHCWQMIRTTDTGGVKMIYNGEVENNQCLNTRGNHVGYTQRTTQTLNTTYYYGTSYTYDKTNNVFSLNGTITTGSINLGEYTCKQTTANGTCSTLYLVDTLSSGSSYYVISLNGNSNYSQFGTLQFNQQYSSPADVGYMYNTRYTYNTKTMTNTETMLSSSSLGTTYWYANSVTWNSTTNKYELNSPYQVSSTSDYPNLVGKYTFGNATQTYTNTSVYYIAAVNNTTMYYIQLSNSGNHTLADYNYTYTYGDSYTDNGNGTYTINNATTINRSDWYTSYSNVKNKYVCKNAVNDTCSELWYTTSTSNTSMTYIKVANNYKYAKGFTWDGSKYVLDNDTSTSFWNFNDSTNKTSINNAHYTCWNVTGECTTISYIYYISGTISYYINITGGKNVETALNEMLYDNNVNSINSTMKSGVDAWYKHYLLEDYNDYIEDTIFCNDRSIRALNGWNPDGGRTIGYLQFKEYSVGSDLSCTNTTDKFSVSNNNAKLTYKVGLMSSPEMNILNNSNARKTGQWYWLASPGSFSSNVANGRDVVAGGGMLPIALDSLGGVRPAISFAPGTLYTSGDGSMANPYIVE